MGREVIVGEKVIKKGSEGGKAMWSPHGLECSPGWLKRFPDDDLRRICPLPFFARK